MNKLIVFLYFLLPLYPLGHAEDSEEKIFSEKIEYLFETKKYMMMLSK